MGNPSIVLCRDESLLPTRSPCPARASFFSSANLAAGQASWRRYVCRALKCGHDVEESGGTGGEFYTTGRVVAKGKGYSL